LNTDEFILAASNHLFGRLIADKERISKVLDEHATARICGESGTKSDRDPQVSPGINSETRKRIFLPLASMLSAQGRGWWLFSGSGNGLGGVVFNRASNPEGRP
jgi:hypothetical protein